MAKNKLPTKADAITVRLNPKTKFALELAARRQRRTLSAIVEEFIYQGLCSDTTFWSDSSSTSVIVNKIWDPDECERFINLALSYPELLDYTEELMWKAINESEIFFTKSNAANLLKGIGQKKKAMKLPLIRKHWELIKQIGTGIKTFSDIPIE